MRVPVHRPLWTLARLADRLSSLRYHLLLVLDPKPGAFVKVFRKASWPKGCFPQRKNAREGKHSLPKEHGQTGKRVVQSKK